MERMKKWQIFYYKNFKKEQNKKRLYIYVIKLYLTLYNSSNPGINNTLCLSSCYWYLRKELQSIFEHLQVSVNKNKNLKLLFYFLLEMGGKPTDPKEILKQFGTDLTEMAKNSKLDPVIGREEEIRRTLQM